MRSTRYQVSLIGLGIVSTIFMGIFFYRELFPEYKIYQEDYIELEKFRSTYTGEAPPNFKIGIKQIVIEREDKGPAVIDRCISCHVALQFPHFSPTKIAKDVNGKILYDANGVPIKEANPQYVWTHLDQRVLELQDEKVNEQLIVQGQSAKVKQRLQEAESLLALKTVEVNDVTYDMTKVLSMHPLMGSETRPFEFHPIETYGCVSCHNGNGRGLTTEKAHGPVFDGQYEKEYIGYVPQFLEKDPRNDPKFARVFNGKPGHELLFQTSPIYVGALIQAKCMQCHVATSSALENAAFSTVALIQEQQNRTKALEAAVVQEKESLLDNIYLANAIRNEGILHVLEELKKRSDEFKRPADELANLSNQMIFLQKIGQGKSNEAASGDAIKELNHNAVVILGSQTLVDTLQAALKDKKDRNEILNQFIEKHKQETDADGTLFAKLAALDLANAVSRHVQDVETSFKKAATDEKAISAIASEVDLLTYNYHRGFDLYISQACYACHRISGFSRGGVGPELTFEGKAYPWYVKQKIAWPQSDLKTSTMPNMHIDHEEIQDLLTFVLGQMGENQANSGTAYRTSLQQWEAGRKTAWERPITPAEMLDLRYSMTVFATQGCAACHRLKGFESNVGFSVEKENGKPDFNTMYAEHQWFQELFPEDITGSQIVKNIDANPLEIKKRISPDVRKNSILEDIEQVQPKTIESFYAPFKYALRAKDQEYKNDPKKLEEWKKSVHNILMMFIQEYGLGRLIGPRPNWSGIYRTDEWLMEHFHNPSGHVAKSIMPVLPFDDTKFYALTHLLDVIGIRNRNEVHAIWENRGFSPELAFHIHCAQCHGDFKQGNGPVAEWIYPIPKNLADGNFLRNLTRENAIHSIKHGVKGTPMPPWGEATHKPGINHIPVLNEDEINKLVDWLFSFLPGEGNLKGNETIPKWNYSPENVIEELKREGNQLQAAPNTESKLQKKFERETQEFTVFSTGDQQIASLDPLLVNSTHPIEDYFDVGPHALSSLEQNSYYIKRKFYTPENIEQGKVFFEMNCAVCHGKEADGSGIRAEAMHDAKPRMLTNLDWIETHDDLRLLRSIKYGVPGTGMTPWGDLTSSLQRMQLVIFIRSLSEDTELRNQLGTALYRAFDDADFTIEKARYDYYSRLANLKAKLIGIQDKRKDLYLKAQKDRDKAKDAMNSYEEELQIQAGIERLESKDKQFVELKSLNKKEKETFENMGKLLIVSQGLNKSFEELLQAIGLSDDAFKNQNGNIRYEFSDEKAKKLKEIGEQIAESVQTKIDQLNVKKSVVEGQINSSRRSQELTDINAQILTMAKVKNSIIAGFEESLRLQAKIKTSAALMNVESNQETESKKDQKKSEQL